MSCLRGFLMTCDVHPKSLDLHIERPAGVARRRLPDKSRTADHSSPVQRGLAAIGPLSENFAGCCTESGSHFSTAAMHIAAAVASPMRCISR